MVPATNSSVCYVCYIDYIRIFVLYFMNVIYLFADDIFLTAIKAKFWDVNFRIQIIYDLQVRLGHMYSFYLPTKT